MRVLAVPVILVILSRIAYLAVFKPAPSSGIHQTTSPILRSWVSSGRYINFDGHAVFIKDSIGDIIASAGDPKGDERKKLTKLQDTVDLPVMLFLHGFPTFSYDFKDIYDVMKGTYHVVAADFLGFGFSDKPDNINYKMMMQSDCIDRVLKSVFKERSLYRKGDSDELKKVVIIAHDYGVTIAQELMARQLDKRKATSVRTSTSGYSIASVVLLNGGLFPETHRPTVVQKLLLSPYLGPFAAFVQSEKLFATALGDVFGNSTKPSAQDMKMYWEVMLHKNGNKLGHKLISYIIDRRTYRERWVGALVAMSGEIPIRLINGPADPVSGAHMVQRYQELVPIKHQDIVFLKGDIGHYPQLEAPESVLRAIRDFLNGPSSADKN
jgi:pimeloyl-ACP methyl ester carboxylesterase